MQQVLYKAKESRPIKLWFLADLHLQSLFVDERLFQDTIDCISKEEDSLAILNGDLLDVALFDSIADAYSVKMNVQASIEKLINLLQPISSKILLVVSGNHEDRIRRRVGVDLLQLISNSFNVPYSSVSGLVDIVIPASDHPSRSYSYVFYITHGMGGGRRPGSVLNNLELSQLIVEGCDMYVWGHSHKFIIYQAMTRQYNNYTKRVLWKEVTYVSLPSFLAYPKYAEKAQFRPQVIKPFYVTLDNTKKQIISLVNSVPSTRKKEMVL